MNYGVPCHEAWQQCNKSSFLDGLFSQLCSDVPVLTDSDEVKKELIFIKEQTELLKSDSLLLKRCRRYDQYFWSTWNNFFDKEPVDFFQQYTDTIANLFSDCMPVIYKLKMHYQRPRPVQLLLQNRGIEFYPFASLSAQAPAWPSMHGTLSMVLAGVCGNKWPQFYKQFNDLFNDIYYSRMYMGLCLPMDMEAAKRTATAILADREFKIKYGL